MGGSSSSSSSANNQRQISQDASENEGVAVSSGGGNVTVTDGGATLQALDFAAESGAGVLDFAESVFSQSVGALEEDNKQQYQQQAEMLASVATAGRSETSQALEKMSTYFFITVCVVAVAFYMRGRK